MNNSIQQTSNLDTDKICLSLSKSHLQNIMFFISDSNGKILLISNQLINILDCDIQDYKSKNINDILKLLLKNDKDIQELVDANKNIFISGESNEFESTIQNSKHANLHVLINTSPIEYLSQNCAITMFIDKSKEDILKQELNKAIKTKDDFLSNISHEIRTPMNGIIGSIDLLELTTLTDEQKEYLDTIKISGNTLLNVISNILDFSKIESEKIILNNQKVCIESCIEELFDLFAEQASNKNLDLLYFIEPNVPKIFLTDASRVRQIFLYLISNAVKYTEQGSVLINVSKISEQNGITTLQFSVKDTGIGISEKDIELIFKPFMQVDESSTRKYGGTGLGLALCNQLVSLLGGKIWVNSKLGEGSTFYFTIDVSTANLSNEQKVKSKSFINPAKALIIDDNIDAQQTLEKDLSCIGITALCINHPKEIFEVIKKGEYFDIIILKQTLCDHSGLELKKHVVDAYKEKNINANTGFIIVAPRFSGKQLMQKIDDKLYVITKPVHKQLLYNTIDAIFKEQKTTENLKDVQQQKNVVPPMKILVVEDNTINQKLIIRILKTLGQEADLATNGAEGFEAVKNKKYDIVLMDIQMPIMDGKEATQKIRKEIPKSEQPKIIAMTAHALLGDREKCLEAGMDDYMSKPILIDVVRNMLLKWYELINQSYSLETSMANTDSTAENTIIARLNELVQETDLEFVNELIDIYVQESPKQLQAIADALNSKNLNALMVSAHTLKGSSLNVGAKQLGSLCLALEEIGRKSPAIPEGTNITQIENELNVVKKILQDFKEKNS